MRNLEYKTQIDDPERCQSMAMALGAEDRGDLQQVDTYFSVAQGRLKLREIAGQPGELIFYKRDENGAGRASDYEVVRSQEPVELRELLEAALGRLAVVTKRRRLLVLDGTRIHLDSVEGLGSFLELEAPVGEDDRSAREKLDRLLEGLGLTWEQCIRASYLDLMMEQKRQGSSF